MSQDDNNDFKRLEGKIDQFDQKVDRRFDAVELRLAGIDNILVSQAGDLKHHIYRTKIAEDNIAMIRSDIKPLQEHVSRFEGIVKFIGMVSLVVSIISGVIYLAIKLLETSGVI